MKIQQSAEDYFETIYILKKETVLYAPLTLSTKWDFPNPPSALR